MKILITGASGTVGNAMIEFLTKKGIETVGWDRKKVSPFDYSEMKSFIEEVSPGMLFHFGVATESTGVLNEPWKINYEWPSELAWITKELGIKFLFTSTAMVFSDHAAGPFTVKSKPDASQGYGFEKLMAEERVRYQNPDSYIVRLGWQIGNNFSGNQMLAWFENEMNRNGVVKASSKWFPACSYLEYTVKEIYRIAVEENPGLFMIDSNEKYTFYDIAAGLNKLYGSRWKIEKDDSFIFDQRMIDEKVKIPKLYF